MDAEDDELDDLSPEEKRLLRWRPPGDVPQVGRDLWSGTNCLMWLVFDFAIFVGAVWLALRLLGAS